MSAITPVFEKACRYIASHSQPIETQGIRPTLNELKADYQAVLRQNNPPKTSFSPLQLTSHFRQFLVGGNYI
jgi:hypothetical protein